MIPTVPKGCSLNAEDDKFANNFCVLPWLQLHVKNNGEIFPCCNMEQLGDRSVEKIQKPELNDSQGYISKNNQLIKKIRLAMLNGEAPEECKACYDLEKVGLKSVRQIKNVKFQKDIFDIQENTHTNGDSDVSIKSLDLRLGNHCNLKCRMCWPSSSSALMREAVDLGFIHPKAYQEKVSYRFESYRKLIEENPAIESIALAGGEPFLIPEFYEILDFLIQTKRAPLISLTIHTNGTKISPELHSKLLEFKETKLLISVDGTDSINSYIRHPADWSLLKENVYEMNRWSENPKFRTQINVTIQAMNLLNVADVVRFSLDHSNFYPPVFTLLNTPEELAIKSLPQKWLEDAHSLMLELIKDLESKPLPQKWTAKERAEFFQSLVSLATKTSTLQSCPTNFTKFVRRMDMVDRYRNTSYLEYGLFLGRSLRDSEQGLDMGSQRKTVFHIDLEHSPFGK